MGCFLRLISIIEGGKFDLLVKKVDLNSKSKLRWGPNAQIPSQDPKELRSKNFDWLREMWEHGTHLRAKTRKTTCFLDIFLFPGGDKVVELQVLRDGVVGGITGSMLLTALPHWGEGKHLNCFYNIWENLANDWKWTTKFSGDSNSGCNVHLDTIQQWVQRNDNENQVESYSQ